MNNINLNFRDSILLTKIRKHFTGISSRGVLAIIPVLGRHSILDICIECIRRQTVSTDIILIVSNQEDSQYAKRKKIKYVYTENNPLSLKFQKGVDYAKLLDAKYIMFVGSDDLLSRGWVEECLLQVENKKINVVGKNYHYIYDSLREKRYMRKYVADNLLNIPKTLRKEWCLGSGRIIKSSILETIEWKLFKREIDRGLDAESGLILYNGGAKFGTISKENFLSIRDDWDCITKFEKIANSESNKLVVIKKFNDDIEILKDEYLKVRIAPVNVEIEKELYRSDIRDTFFEKRLLIYDGTKEEKELNRDAYGRLIYEKILSRLNGYKIIYSSKINMNNVEELDGVFCVLMLNKNNMEADIERIKMYGECGIPVINNGKLPNILNWNSDKDIVEKIYMLSKYNRHKFYHKIKCNIESLDRSDIFRFAKNMKFKQQIEQIYISPSLKFFSDRIFSKYPKLRRYNDPDKPAIFFGIYDRDDDRMKLLNHKSTGVIIWGGSDIYFKTLYETKYMDKIKTLNNLYHIAISKDISDMLSINDIEHIFTIFSFVDYDIFKPVPKGDSIYVYLGDSTTYNSPIIEYLKTHYLKYKFIEITPKSRNYNEMSDIYSQCFIGIRLTDFDGNANTVQELGLMGIKCIHNGTYPNSILWSLNNINAIIGIIENESKNIGKIDYEIANETKKYIEANNKTEYILYADFYSLTKELDLSFNVSVIINTLDNDNEKLKSIIDDHLNQIGLENIQIIISTIEGDKSISLYDKYYVNNNKVDICISKKEKHPGRGYRGIYYQINKACKMIKYNWVAYFSGNDKVYRTKYTTEITTCIENGKLICNSSYIRKFNNNSKKVEFNRDYDYNEHLKSNFISDCSLINVYVLNRLLPFNLECENHAFWDLFLRAYESFGDIFCYNDIPTWEYIITDDSAHIKRANNMELKRENEYSRIKMLENHNFS